MSKLIITPTRHFNSLDDCGDFFIKSSVDLEKMRAEINYYSNLSEELKRFHPKFLGESGAGTWENGYKIEKIVESDQSVFFTALDKSKTFDLNNFLENISRYFEIVPKKEVSKVMYITKLTQHFFVRDLNRLNSLREKHIYKKIGNLFHNECGEDPYVFLENLHGAILDQINLLKSYCLWESHGDLCLSNILIFNSQLYLVDPRGRYENDSFLSPYYDMGKLCQCLLFGYDFINHELNFNPNIKNKEKNEDVFNEFILRYGLDLKTVKLISASHFMAMLPLHISSQQKVLAFAKQSILAFKDAMNE